MLIVGYLFGWKMADGSRRFTELFLYIPRKNGKTTLAAGLLILLFLFDGEPAAQVYCAAADTDQANIVFKEAASMIEQDPELSDAVKVIHSYKSMQHGNSIMKVLSSVSKTKHGLNLSGYVIDELHAQKDDSLVEALETGTGSRRQPLGIVLTTADYAGESVCNDKLSLAENVRDGKYPLPDLLPVIYKADKNDDWADMQTWKKANPNFGVSLKDSYARKQIAKAKLQPNYLHSLLRLNLNIQTNKKIMWEAMSEWQANNGKFDEAELIEHPCYGAIDLGSTSDITVFLRYWPHNHAIISRFYVPQSAIDTNKAYQKWHADGYLLSTPGNVTDYDYVREDINQIDKVFDMVDLTYDAWNASQLVNNLTEHDGFEMTEFRQGYKSMSPAAKEVERLALQHSFRHNGDPVLSWMASNTAIVEDPSGNIKPVKPKRTSSIKIDGIVALCMAVGRSIIGKEAETYSQQGKLITL